MVEHEDKTKLAKMRKTVNAPVDVQIIINTDKEGKRELVIDTGVCAIVLGPDLVTTLEHVLFETSEEVEQMVANLDQKGLKES